MSTSGTTRPPAARADPREADGTRPDGPLPYVSPVRVLLAPRMWWLHVVGLVALVAAVLLGTWQYQAWQGHRADEASRATAGPAQSLDDLLGPDQPFPQSSVGHPVSLRGTWAPQGSFAVSGRESEGRRGFWVVTPLVVASGSAIPVVRGWSPTPDVTPPRGGAAFDAVLQPGEGSGLPDPTPGDRVLPELRIASITSLLDRDLYGGYAVADGVQPAGASGLVPVTPDQVPDVGALTSVRNLFYAFEWWVFGAFAVYLWWRWGRDEVESERERAGAAGADGAQGPLSDGR